MTDDSATDAREAEIKAVSDALIGTAIVAQWLDENGVVTDTTGFAKAAITALDAHRAVNGIVPPYIELVGYQDWSNGRLKTVYQVEQERQMAIDEDDLGVFEGWLSGCDPLYRFSDKETTDGHS